MLLFGYWRSLGNQGRVKSAEQQPATRQGKDFSGAPLVSGPLLPPLSGSRHFRRRPASQFNSWRNKEGSNQQPGPEGEQCKAHLLSANTAIFFQVLIPTPLSLARPP
jgi:hypothetical protein